MTPGCRPAVITARGNRYTCPVERPGRDRGRSITTDHGTEHRGPGRTGGEAEGFGGDGRTKHVTVLTVDGEVRERGDVYVTPSIRRTSVV